MSSEPRRPDQPDNNQSSTLGWLLVAFLPSALGLVSRGFTKSIDILLPVVVVLLVLNLGLSIAAAVSLTAGIKDSVGRACVAFFLFSFFLLVNFYVVMAAGCSGLF